MVKCFKPNESEQMLGINALNEDVDVLPCLKLFHEDYDIPARRLIVYWIIEGLVKLESHNNKSLEKFAKKHLRGLI